MHIVITYMDSDGTCWISTPETRNLGDAAVWVTETAATTTTSCASSSRPPGPGGSGSAGASLGTLLWRLGHAANAQVAELPEIELRQTNRETLLVCYGWSADDFEWLDGV